MGLSARVQALKTMNETITAYDMKMLESVFETLFTGHEPEVFPIDQSKFQAAMPVKPSMGSEIICGEGGDEFSEWQQHQAVLKNVTGTVVALRIEKIGLKD